MSAAQKILVFLLAVLVAAAAGCYPEQQRKDRLLLVVSTARNQLLILDRETGRELAAVATGVGPHQLAVHPEGARAVVANYGTRENAGSSLTVVDLRTRTASGTIDLGRYRRPHGITFLADPDIVLVTAVANRALLRVNLASGEIEQAIALRQRGSHQVVASADESRAYVANLESGSVSAVDLREGRALQRLKLGGVVEGIALSPDGGRLWAADSDKDLISVIDTASLEVVERIECSSYPVRLLLSADGEKLLVSKARSSEVTVVRVGEPDEQTSVPMVLEEEQRKENRIELRPVPIEMALSPDLPRAFVANSNADMIAVLDLEKLEVLRWMRGPEQPEGIAAVNVE